MGKMGGRKETEGPKENTPIISCYGLVSGRVRDDEERTAPVCRVVIVAFALTYLLTSLFAI